MVKGNVTDECDNWHPLKGDILSVTPAPKNGYDTVNWLYQKYFISPEWKQFGEGTKKGKPGYLKAIIEVKPIGQTKKFDEKNYASIRRRIFFSYRPINLKKDIRGPKILRSTGGHKVAIMWCLINSIDFIYKQWTPFPARRFRCKISTSGGRVFLTSWLFLREFRLSLWDNIMRR